MARSGKSETMTMDAGEVSRLCGVDRRKVREWQNLGLIRGRHFDDGQGSRGYTKFRAVDCLAVMLARTAKAAGVDPNVSASIMVAVSSHSDEDFNAALAETLGANGPPASHNPNGEQSGNEVATAPLSRHPVGIVDSSGSNFLFFDVTSVCIYGYKVC